MNHRRLFIVIIFILSMLATSCGVKPVNNQQNLKVQAWTFPSGKTCDATSDITDPARHYDVLKPEYYNLQDNGTLTKLTTGCNAYSADNVALVKQYSTQQFVTVSGNTAGMNALATNRNLTSAFLSELYSFLQTSGFTGVELDFEGFGQWTPQQYANYQSLVKAVGNAMHAIKCKLMIDGPAISDATYQKYYLWKWEDFDKMPQVDFLTVMAYDEENDQGAGTPVASLAWIGNICQWMLNKVSDHSKIVIGINSYGYTAKTGAYTVTKNTYQQSAQLPGFNTAKRDISSGEMMWTANGISSDFSDQATVQGKINVVLNAGLNAVSIWHLGGGNPFPIQIPQPTPVPTPTPSPVPTPQSTSITLTQGQLKAIVGALSLDQITTLKNIVGQQ